MARIVEFGAETGHGHMVSLCMECLSVNNKYGDDVGFVGYYRMILD